jgi:hypothetical protein
MMAGLYALLALAGIARTESASMERTVVVPEVEVRSGPSDKFYATSKLRQGDRVRLVDSKDPNWLAIQPPAGSFSWIQDRFLERHSGPYAVVLGSDVPVRIGSALVNTPPNVEQVKVQRGTPVVILSTRGAADTGGTWLPIEPPTQEVRYIPANAVQASTTVQQTVSSAPPAAPAGADPRWTQAEQAEKAGNLPEAIRLYAELGHQLIDTNHALAVECFNRVSTLSARLANSAAPPAGPRGPADTRPAPTPNPAARATSQYTYARDGSTPQPPQWTSPQPPPTPAPAPMGQWSGPGTLQRSTVLVDGKVAYVLDRIGVQPRYIYVTGAPGILDPAVNRFVNLYGTFVYHGTMRTYYMTVSQVVPAQ